jgi:hypothetical protein
VKLAIPGEDEEALDSDGPGLPKEQAAEEEQDAKAFAERRKMPISLASASLREKDRRVRCAGKIDTERLFTISIFCCPWSRVFPWGRKCFLPPPERGPGLIAWR